jgi:hypothetical protein
MDAFEGGTFQNDKIIYNRLRFRRDIRGGNPPVTWF